jgi:hypothetical protein
MPERHAITLELTDTQVLALRQAAYDYASERYDARLERIATVQPLMPSDRHPSPMERAGWELLRLVDKATDPLVLEEVRNAMPPM